MRESSIYFTSSSPSSPSSQYGSDKKFAMFRQALELLSGGDREHRSRGDEGLIDINSFPPAQEPPCTSAVVGVKMS